MQSKSPRNFSARQCLWTVLYCKYSFSRFCVPCFTFHSRSFEIFQNHFALIHFMSCHVMTFVFSRFILWYVTSLESFVHRFMRFIVVIMLFMTEFLIEECLQHTENWRRRATARYLGFPKKTFTETQNPTVNMYITERNLGFQKHSLRMLTKLRIKKLRKWLKQELISYDPAVSHGERSQNSS